jgi:hypothetical protein
LALGRPATSLIHVIQDDIEQDISWVVNTGTLEGQGSELLRKPVPPEELPEVDVANLEGLHVLEHIQWHRRVERKLLVALDKPGAPVWRQPQTRDLGEG